MEQLSFLFNEAEVFAAVKEEEATTVVVAHKRRKKNNDYTLDSISEDLPRERIEHRLEGEDVTLVGCWAHLRRKFDEAAKALPKGNVKGSSTSQGLAYCDLLFAIEQGLAEKNATTGRNGALNLLSLTERISSSPIHRRVPPAVRSCSA